MVSQESVSVIIPNYNYGRFLGAAIDSALAQTMPPTEILVVDDGSTDHSVDIVGAYGPAVRLIRQRNGGVAQARNVGASEACGNFLAFLDADDFWLPEKLERQLSLFRENPDLGLVHCQVVRFRDAGVIVGKELAGMEGHVSRELLLFRKSVVIAPGSTMVVPKQVFDEVGGFDPCCPSSEDWDLAYRIAARRPIGFIQKVLVHYRQHGAGGHLNIEKMEKGAMRGLQKAFQVDPSLAPIRQACYGNLHQVLSANYFNAGDYRRGLRHMVSSLVRTPENMVYFLRIPIWILRGLSRRLA